MNALKDYPLDVLNESGETIPGFAVMQISGWESDRNGRDYIKVKKPDGDGTMFLLNSPFPIENDKIGRANESGRVYGLYDSGDGTPAVDESWGPESGSWKLKKDNSGFFIIGDHKGTGDNARVRVKLAASAGGGGVVAVDATISAAGWNSATNTRTPETFTYYKFVDDVLDFEHEYTGTSDWPVSIPVDSDKIKFIYVDGSGKLVTAYCSSSDYTPPEE